MDLSLAAFTTIAEQKKGKINVRFERLGDAWMKPIADHCAKRELFQERVAPAVLLKPGVPHALQIGEVMTVSANATLIIRAIQYPDGSLDAMQKPILAGEQFSFVPMYEGAYVFKLGTTDGKQREMTMQVIDCLKK
jgi:hypothetical protein